MSAGWGALAARARGLASHLLGEGQLSRLDAATSVIVLAEELEATAYGRFLPPRASEPGALETAVSRSLAERLQTLSLWCEPKGDPLAVVFLDQDVQNVRVLLRGAAGGLGPELRLAGCIPTATLPRKALEVLARAEAPASVAATLTAWEHPLGSPLLAEAKGTHSDAFRMEVALVRTVALTMPFAAESGGRHLRGFVTDAVDAHNVIAALVLAGARREGADTDLFVEGGRYLSKEAFVRAASAEQRGGATRTLDEELRRTPFAEAFDVPSSSPAALAVRILVGRIERLRRGARLDPVSPLPVLLFVLSLREEARRLRLALWRLALARGAAA